MTARLKNPAVLIPEAMPIMQSLGTISRDHGVPEATLELVHLRASQLNGCAWCIDFGYRNAVKAGETGERLAMVAAWREATVFDDAERAALALAEEMTRLADRLDPVPDPVWDEAARHYDDEALAALVMHISITNLYNRFNVATRQVPGTWA